ncbi:MAG: hypothetical protein CUN53_02850 [Phototrophicales bacterium]|nr:MAG: hypothetical protein CUN53_02850 [Phototrophicales bacterium]
MGRSAQQICNILMIISVDVLSILKLIGGTVMKRVVLVLALVMVFGAAVIPAAAVPTADLTALSSVFPANTAIFAAIRTDDGYIETLDSVIARLNEVLPPSDQIDSLRDTFEMGAGMMGGSFDSVIRSWLGDTAALGVDISYLIDRDERNDYLAATLAIAVTDSAAAVKFVRGLLSSQGDFDAQYTVEVSDGVTIFRPTRTEPRLDGVIPFMFTENYVVMGNLAPVMNRMARLNTNTDFNDTMSALPLDDYNIALYIDTRALFDAQMTMLSDMDDIAEMGEMIGMLTGISNNLGSIGIGFTVIDDRSLTIDIVSTADPEAIAGALGLDGDAIVVAQPIDPSFARFIPAGTPIVTHVTNLSDAYDALLTGLRAGVSLGGADAEDVEEALAEIESGIAGVEFAIRGLTGLDLEDDILSWMTGDLAIWVGLTPTFAEATSLFGGLAGGLPVDFGILIDASANPDGAAALVEGLKSALTFAARQTPANSGTRITLTDETIGGNAAVSVNIVDRSLPFPIELVIGASADVFVIGTRAAAEAALNPGAGLDSDPAFQEALRYALADTVQLQYLAGAPLAPLFNLLPMEGSANDAQVLVDFVSLLSSSSISSATVDGISYVRLVLTLAA